MSSALLIKVDGETAKLPAANFSGDGHVVFSEMDEGAIKDAARGQDTTRISAGSTRPPGPPKAAPEAAMPSYGA